MFDYEIAYIKEKVEKRFSFSFLGHLLLFVELGFEVLNFVAGALLLVFLYGKFHIQAQLTYNEVHTNERSILQKET